MSLVKVCENCLNPFPVFMSRRAANQRLCPACQAEAAEEIRSVPQWRTCIFSGLGLIDSLPPAAWEQRPPKRSHDDPYFRLQVFGYDLGEDNAAGRIVLNAPEPIAPGTVVFIRAMKAIHRTKDSGALEVREYLSLAARPDAQPTAALTWLEGPAPEGAIYAQSVTGGGRTGTLIILPLADTGGQAHPADETFDEDEAYEEVAGDELLFGAATARLLPQEVE